MRTGESNWCEVISSRSEAGVEMVDVHACSAEQVHQGLEEWLHLVDERKPGMFSLHISNDNCTAKEEEDIGASVQTWKKLWLMMLENSLLPCLYRENNRSVPSD